MQSGRLDEHFYVRLISEIKERSWLLMRLNPLMCLARTEKATSDVLDSNSDSDCVIDLCVWFELCVWLAIDSSSVF